MAGFKDLGVSDKLVKGLDAMEIVTPTQIQKEAIPILLAGQNDLVGQAATGTGKTAAFGLPLLQSVDSRNKKVQGLILCPTRELGIQIAKQLFKYTKFTDKIFAECVYGGERIEIQISRLQRPTHIIVATPGRLLDLVARKVVDLYNVETVILDEADEMLTMGFKDDLDVILKQLKNVKRKWLFSATMPHGIKQLVNDHLSEDAVRLEIEKNNAKISHQYLICNPDEKLNYLIQFLNKQEGERGVIFCKTKKAVQKLAKQLIAKNISADGLHGDLLQKERDKVMRAFRNENLQLLVATDLAARGIDVEALNYVIHYEQPDKEEFYTHRSGRTARGGRSGLSFSLVTSIEMKNIRHFERSLGIVFKQVTSV